MNTTTPTKIILSTGKGIEVLAIDEVVMVEAEGKHSKVIYSGGNQKVIHVSIGDIAESLEERGFTYSHKSFLVNMRYVDRCVGDEVELAGGFTAPLARRRKKAFIQMLEDWYQHKRITTA